jgi:lysophospholipase L1-like esterase
VAARTFRRIACAALATLAALDLVFNFVLIRGGAFRDRPIAPFAAVSGPKQRAWLAGMRRELAGTQSSGHTAQFDPELGWCHVAGRATGPAATLAFSYNQIGARARREHEPRPAPGTTRIACFGDSFTHGDEVGDLDTWQAQLEELEPAFEVLNFGVAGYGTDQALLRFRRDGRGLGAHVVCIGFLTENIGRNVNRYRPLWYPGTTSCVAKPRFVLGERGELELVPLPYATKADFVAAIETGRVLDDLAEHEYWSSESRARWLRVSGLARLAVSAWAYWRRDVERVFADRSAEPYRVTLALLEGFAREARESGAEAAVVLVFPREADLEAFALDGNRFWQPLLDDLAARGVEALDLAPPLADAWRSARADASLARVYQGGHLSRAGNGLAARELEAWLRDRLGSAGRRGVRAR